MQVAIFSRKSELSDRLAEEIGVAGHGPLLIDPSADWAGELAEQPFAVALLDVSADSSAIARVSLAMREASGASRVHQIAVVEAGGLGEEHVPPTVDELAVYPFRAGELSAKLALVESARRMPSGTTLIFGDVVIDTVAYEVILAGVPVSLTFKEQELLHFLATHPDRVFSRSQLLTEVWGYDYFGGTRTVDVHIRRLRFKLAPEMEARIQTVRNVGYKFVSNI